MTQLVTDAAADKVEIERIKSSSEAERKTTQEYAAEATNKIADIRGESERVAALKSTVEAYQSQFDSFQASLDERMKSFRDRDTEHSSLTNRMMQTEAEIKRLLDAADAMLKGATVAGLASAYAKMRDSLKWQLFFARLAFYAGILLLIASVTPLAIYTVPYLAELLRIPQPQPPSDVWLYALQLAARLVLLIPAAWFLRFTANRHAALFRLREEYAHRYALASSVEGFKKQAETFKEEIAAITYAHLTVNPASTLDGHSKASEGDPPNPLMKAVLDRIQGQQARPTSG